MHYFFNRPYLFLEYFILKRIKQQSNNRIIQLIDFFIESNHNRRSELHFTAWCNHRTKMTHPAIQTFWPRPDKSVKDNSANLKFRQFSQNYPENSARDNSINNSDRRSRDSVLRACQQRVGVYTKFRAGYRREAATRAWRSTWRP